MTGPRVAIVIVTYRSREDVGAALGALAFEIASGVVECVVVDNASDDGTAAWVEREFAFARVVRNARNEGFGRGCRRGAAATTAPLILLLNPDAVITPDALWTLVEYIERNPKIGAVGPASVGKAGEVQTAGGLPTPQSILRSALRGSSEMVPIRPGSAPFRTDWLCGSVLLLRRRAWDAVGGFDPRFFLYFEETDLCHRLGRAGWELWATGRVVVDHVGGSSAATADSSFVSGCIAEHYYRSRMYYLVKHHGWLAASGVEIGELILLGTLALPRSLLGRGGGSLLKRLSGPVLRMPARNTVTCA